MLVSAKDMLNAAAKGHYAVAAFNTNNLEWAASILDAAEATQSPVIIQCTSGAAKWQVSFKVVADIVKNLVEDKNITVPVALHLDHGTYEDCLKCIDAGFTSVMYDGSHEETFEINLEKTAKIVEIAHAKGISVEAEVAAASAASRTASPPRASWPTRSSARPSPTRASTSSLAASATSTVCIPRIGRACPSTVCRRSRTWSATCRSFSMAAPASRPTWCRRPSAWASPRST